MAIVRTHTGISKLNQAVYINGRRDDRFWCTNIRMGSHCGISEAEFVVPEFYADDVTNDLRDAFVRVVADNGGKTHFAGYLAVDSGDLSPNGETVVLRAYTITKWMDRIHVGQDEGRWEKSYFVQNPVTGMLTGWTPALILQDLFSRMPQEYLDRIALGDLRVLEGIADLSSPEITFRLTSYAEAINTVISLLGDVAFRERFDGEQVLLDFYRVNEPTGSKAFVRHASWNAPGRANVQRSRGTNDATQLIDRVIGYGAYRQFMVTCRNYLANAEDISELDPQVRLVPWWNPGLEALALKSPILTTRASGYNALIKTELDDSSTSFEVEVGVGIIPVGAILTAPSGEQMRVTSFAPEVLPDPEADPPVAGSPASVTVERGINGTTAAAAALDDTITIVVPGLEHVFRRFRLPMALNSCDIMRTGCMTDGAGNPYPMVQAFVYEAVEIEREDDGDGNKWVEGVLPESIAHVTPSRVDGNVQLDVDTRTVTFPKPVLTVLSKKVNSGSGTAKEKMLTEYQRTVCGVTITVENRAYPFFYDTGIVAGASNYDFNTAGFTDRWQKNELHSWRLGTMQYPINGVNFPCVFFPMENNPDEGQAQGSAIYFAAGTGYVSRTDFEQLKGLCDQILRERNRRARSWSIVIPWFSPGYVVGQQVEIEGLRNFPRDIYKITSVEHSMPISGEHETVLTIDNIKPPVRHKVRTMR